MYFSLRGCSNPRLAGVESPDDVAQDAHDYRERESEHDERDDVVLSLIGYEWHLAVPSFSFLRAYGASGEILIVLLCIYSFIRVF